MGDFLKSYLARIAPGNPGLAKSIAGTVQAVVPAHIETFSYQEHIAGLLMGEVQSGKTAQMFGILCAAADLDFKLFLILTTDQVMLQQQTFKRALEDLGDKFTVCDETDYLKFADCSLRRPTLVVLKKNAKVLPKWLDFLATSRYCRSNPLVIFDDEADAASLNTRINQQMRSTINQTIASIRKLSNSSMYIQVTATPQSVILQTSASNWKPAFIHYFAPGRRYLGGRFFYSEPKSFAVRVTADNEFDRMLRGTEVADGLEKAILSFLVAGAHILSTGEGEVCNFLIHPSVRMGHHDHVAGLVRNYIERLPGLLNGEGIEKLEAAWFDMQSTRPDLIELDGVKAFLAGCKIPVVVLNSRESPADCDEGMNIIVGGNSLGRGITFPALQTVYYCRSAKIPQADTYWQHCRMFGYDRDPNLMRLYLPGPLLDLFTELHQANQMLVRQVQEVDAESIGLLYPKNIRPTRKNVVDKNAVALIVGGTGYFPRDPVEDNCGMLDLFLGKFGDGEYDVRCGEAAALLDFCSANDLGLWGSSAFCDCLGSGDCVRDWQSAKLIVRRGRNVAKGTGTLLSPNDRALSEQTDDRPVLIFYRLNGDCSKGWLGRPFWIPHIKFPKGKNFHISME